jgi:hypothetical protein
MLLKAMAVVVGLTRKEKFAHDVCRVIRDGPPCGTRIRYKRAIGDQATIDGPVHQLAIGSGARQLDGAFRALSFFRIAVFVASSQLVPR